MVQSAAKSVPAGTFSASKCLLFRERDVPAGTLWKARRQLICSDMQFRSQPSPLILLPSSHSS